MNCEDIAFNLMVSNATGKPPIKVELLNQNTIRRPICDPVGSKEEVAINQQLNSRREITATGGSTEEVQMLNSEL